MYDHDDTLSPVVSLVEPLYLYHSTSHASLIVIISFTLLDRFVLA